MNKFLKTIHDMIEIISGKRPEEPKQHKCCGGDCKPKRARNKKGRYKSDDPKTKDYNEAYVGGKAPKDLLGLKKRKK
mgnify:CR=1 FL=1